MNAAPTPGRRIAEARNNVLERLRIIEEIYDPDLWEEADGKLYDVLETYRENQRKQVADPKIRQARFSDEELAVMACQNAAADFVMGADLTLSDEIVDALAKEGD